MDYKYLGKSYNRPDAISKVTGKAIYLDDIHLPGMLYTAILRPEYAHAKILNISTGEAEKMPGVVKVVTGKGCHYRYGDNIRDLVPMVSIGYATSASRLRRLSPIHPHTPRPLLQRSKLSTNRCPFMWTLATPSSRMQCLSTRITDRSGTFPPSVLCPIRTSQTFITC